MGVARREAVVAFGKPSGSSFLLLLLLLLVLLHYDRFLPGGELFQGLFGRLFSRLSVP